LWLGLAFMGVSLFTGCATTPPPEAEQRLAALESEAQQMDALLDDVETRLLGNQAMLLTWQELGRRHKQVSAVHCQHANSHMEAIVKHHNRQEEKARQLKRRRVAAVDAAVLTSGKAAPKRSRN
jgi:hypothetical protein